VISRNTTIPTKKHVTFTVASDHPDCTEIVYIGHAAAAAAAAAAGGGMEPEPEASSRSATLSGSAEFTAAAQIQAQIRGFLTRRHTGQSRMRIQFYEGERKMTKDNIKLGEIAFDIPAARRGQRTLPRSGLVSTF
jgi:molecular chaperone DnaK (HSP70)